MKKKLSNIRVDGGATENNLLMQLQADYLGQSVERPQVIETTVAGAAFLAGLGIGFWKSTEEIHSIWKSDRVFTPRIAKKERDQRLLRWQKAIERTILK